jgi:hypothetical protein
MELLLNRKEELTKALRDLRRQMAVQRRLLRRAQYRQRTKIVSEIKRLGDSIENISEALFDINTFLQLRKENISLK